MPHDGIGGKYLRLYQILLYPSGQYGRLQKPVAGDRHAKPPHQCTKSRGGNGCRHSHRRKPGNDKGQRIPLPVCKPHKIKKLPVHQRQAYRFAVNKKQTPGAPQGSSGQ